MATKPELLLRPSLSMKDSGARSSELRRRIRVLATGGARWGLNFYDDED